MNDSHENNGESSGPGQPPRAAGWTRNLWSRAGRVVAPVQAFFRRHDLVPLGAPSTPWRDILPRELLHKISAAVAAALFVLYVGRWLDGMEGWLFDPLLQNDDVRTFIFPFHRYGPEGALANDPIAREMLDYVPPLVWLCYRILVPLSGIFMATKIVQIGALCIVFLAGFLVVRSRRGGLGAGLLLIFFVLHTEFMINRVTGGLPRAFAFPAMALWTAGAVTQSERQRFSAALLGALTYPSTMALILAAEGLMVMRGVFSKAHRAGLKSRLARYGLLVATCFLAMLPFLVGKPHRGSVHTLAEAKKEPGFKPGGRIPIVPFKDPIAYFPSNLVRPFKAVGQKPVPSLFRKYQKHGSTGPMLILVALLLLAFSRASPRPDPAVSFLAGTIIMYFLARVFAFRLYIPGRYGEYGLTATCMVLTVCAVGLVAHRLEDPRSSTIRNFAFAGFILVMCAFTGDGVVKRNGLSLDGRRNARLFAFARTLPATSRIATHPSDGNDLPYWAGRATMGGNETAHPWFKGSWRRQIRRFKDTMRALYATDRRTVLEYCKKHSISHFLLRRDRYGPHFCRQARFFEPIGRFTRKLLLGVRRKDLILGQVHPQTVVFRHGRWTVVDVARLKQLWQRDGS